MTGPKIQRTRTSYLFLYTAANNRREKPAPQGTGQKLKQHQETSNQQEQFRKSMNAFAKAPRNISAGPQGSISSRKHVEYRYECSTCDELDGNTDGNKAFAHFAMENKTRRSDSQWRHALRQTIVIVEPQSE